MMRKWETEGRKTLGRGEGGEIMTHAGFSCTTYEKERRKSTEAYTGGGRPNVNSEGQSGAFLGSTTKVNPRGEDF